MNFWIAALIALVDAEYMKSQRIPIGQGRSILNILKSLGDHRGTDTAEEAVASDSTKTGSEEHVVGEQPGQYHQTLLDSLMAQQAQMTGTRTNRPHNLISPNPVLANVTKKT